MNSASDARRRVAPLAPDDRRAALIEATLPLLVEFGAAVSTRQIAQAAGVAEGTIFRVFPDKNSLILAVLRHALDPEPAIRALRQIPTRLDLRDRLVGAATLMLAGMKRSGRLHMLARQIVIELGQESQFGAEMRENHLRVQMALATVFEPDRARLRVSPHTAARLLLLNIIGTGGPLFGETETLDADEIVSLVLDGLLTRPPADGAGSGTGPAGGPTGRPGTDAPGGPARRTPPTTSPDPEENPC